MRYTHNAIGGPDWLLVGIPLNSGGVMIFATNELGSVHLEGEMTTEDFQTFVMAIAEKISYNMVYTFKTSFTHVFYAKGETYAEAIVTLFRQWSPREPERTKIEPQRGLPTQTID